MVNSRKLLFRVDASTQIGTGHVMRGLALAQAWQDTQGQPIFAMATSVPALEARLKSEGMQVVSLTVKSGSAEDAKETAALADQFEASWVVVDGYQFGGEYQKILKKAGLRLLFIDDYGHAEHYYADFVLNQNISAGEIDIYHQSILNFTPTRKWDFVLIKGVLIHINPDYLEQVYDRLYQSSDRYS